MKILTDLTYKSECFYHCHDIMHLLKVFFNDGTSSVILYRIAEFFRFIRIPFLGYVFIELNKLLYGCVIGRHAEFDEGFVLMHPVGVVINSKVKGGKYIVLESGVVIGAADNGLPVKVPTLGDNIFIGSGAKILGDIKIGNNVKVGANAVVIKDVPDNSTVVGIPARVVRVDK